MLKHSVVIDYLKLTICSIIFIVIFYFNYRSITFSLVFTVLAMLWFGFLFNSRKPMKINKEVYIRLLAFSVMTVISFGVTYLLKKEKLCYLPGLGALTLNLIWGLCIKRNRNKGTTQCDYNKLLQRVDSNDVLFDAQKEDLKTILLLRLLKVEIFSNHIQECILTFCA